METPDGCGGDRSLRDLGEGTGNLLIGGPLLAVLTGRGPGTVAGGGEAGERHEKGDPEGFGGQPDLVSHGALR